jgi:hypothetical protein
VPAGRDDELIVKVAGLVGVAATVRVTVAVADWAADDESETEMPNEKLPLAVGVPEITPEAVARASPAGSCPDARLQVYGAAPPVAARVPV